MVLSLLALMAGCACLRPECAPTPTPAAAAPSAEQRRDVLYSCACGLPLKRGHVIRVEGNEAILCQCHEGCKCGGVDPKDAGKCMCGNPVKRISMQGTGLYFCNCGGACSCNTVSVMPDKCRCGMDLKKAD